MNNSPDDLLQNLLDNFLDNLLDNLRDNLLDNLPCNLLENLLDLLPEKLRKRVTIPKFLCFKVGAPVMLTVNLSSKLCNGMCGVVKELHEKSVVVFFDIINESHELTPYDFYRIGLHGKQIFITKQIPLKLSFAMTIHKCQGMTLDFVDLDCRGVFEPGQLAVALGRVKTKTNIRVQNYHPSLCIQHSPLLNAYYGEENRDFNTNLDCCKHNCTPISSD